MYETGTFVGVAVAVVFIGYVIYRVVKERKQKGGDLPRKPPGDQKPK